MSYFAKATKSRFDQLKALSRRLNKLSAEVTRVGNAIDEVEEYSYQFNVKIIGLPEKSSETTAETSELCVKLFQEMGTEVFLSDIDIAHRVPLRQQNGAPKPVICKFVSLCTDVPPPSGKIGRGFPDFS